MVAERSTFCVCVWGWVWVGFHVPPYRPLLAWPGLCTLEGVVEGRVPRGRPWAGRCTFRTNSSLLPLQLQVSVRPCAVAARDDGGCRQECWTVGSRAVSLGRVPILGWCLQARRRARVCIEI